MKCALCHKEIRKPDLAHGCKPMKLKNSFFAFALNEFNYKRVGFSTHKTQVTAEAHAYRYSGQKQRARNRRWAGAESAYSDLFPQVVAGLDAFLKFAEESNYTIDWKYRVLIHPDSQK